jgi:hypothetical protein
MATFNGHRNWNHWNVALWIANDEGLYGEALSAVRNHPTKDAAARSLLSTFDKQTPDGAPYTFTSIRAALVGLE